MKNADFIVRLILAALFILVAVMACSANDRTCAERSWRWVPTSLAANGVEYGRLYIVEDKRRPRLVASNARLEPCDREYMDLGE